MNKFNDKSIYRFLKKLGAMRTVAPSEVIPILDVLDWFYWIVIGCFGWNVVVDNVRRLEQQQRSTNVFCDCNSMLYYIYMIWKVSE